MAKCDICSLIGVLLFDKLGNLSHESIIPSKGKITHFYFERNIFYMPIFITNSNLAKLYNLCFHFSKSCGKCVKMC